MARLKPAFAAATLMVSVFLRLIAAPHPSGARCFLLVHVYHVASGKPVAALLRLGKTPSGAEVRRARSPTSSGWS